jgi:hypothetical protein
MPVVAFPATDCNPRWLVKRNAIVRALTISRIRNFFALLISHLFSGHRAKRRGGHNAG